MKIEFKYSNKNNFNNILRKEPINVLLNKKLLNKSKINNTFHAKFFDPIIRDYIYITKNGLKKSSFIKKDQLNNLSEWEVKNNFISFFQKNEDKYNILDLYPIKYQRDLLSNYLFDIYQKKYYYFKLINYYKKTKYNKLIKRSVIPNIAYNLYFYKINSRYKSLFLTNQGLILGRQRKFFENFLNLEIKNFNTNLNSSLIESIYLYSLFSNYMNRNGKNILINSINLKKTILYKHYYEFFINKTLLNLKQLNKKEKIKKSLLKLFFNKLLYLQEANITYNYALYYKSMDNNLLMDYITNRKLLPININDNLPLIHYFSYTKLTIRDNWSIFNTIKKFNGKLKDFLELNSYLLTKKFIFKINPTVKLIGFRNKEIHNNNNTDFFIKKINHYDPKNPFLFYYLTILKKNK